MRTAILSAALAAPLAAGPALAQDAIGTIIDRDREEIGTIEMYDTASGLVRIVIGATEIPEGVHGIHLHDTGDCSAEDFSSADDHIAGDAQHGFEVEGGPHPGDLPNAHVQSDGVLEVEHVSHLIALDESMIFDEDGSAFIIHSDPDDYESQPSGDSGSRLACAVIERGAG